MGSFIATLLPILTAALEEAPAIIEEAPIIIKNIKRIWELATTTVPPSADEQAAFDDALDDAHAALQSS